MDPVVREAFTAEARTPADPAAVAVCTGCPVLTECARYAGSTRYLIGIWGGRRRREQPYGRRGRVVERREITALPGRPIRRRPVSIP